MALQIGEINTQMPVDETLGDEKSQRIFNNEDLSTFDADLASGKLKRVIRVEINATGETCRLKLPRTYELNSNVRNTEGVEKERDHIFVCKDLSRSMFPKY